MGNEVVFEILLKGIASRFNIEACTHSADSVARAAMELRACEWMRARGDALIHEPFECRAAVWTRPGARQAPGSSLSSRPCR
jgi:hypothetical protein